MRTNKRDRDTRSGRQESGVNLATQHLPHGASDTTSKCLRVYIKTFGCQMNVRDSEVVKGLLLAEGYKLTEEPDEADVVLYNTCSVRQHAEEKVWSEVGRTGRLRKLQAAGCMKKPGACSLKPEAKKPIIGIIGCMAENYKREIFRRAPAVDIVCGPSHIDNIALYIEEAVRSRQSVLGVGEKKRKDAIYHTGFYEEKNHAYVVISEGCDNFCSYCVVPYVRGRLRHRSEKDILEEVKAALDSGIENITLLGQNVNSYNSSVNFVELLERVSDVKGLKSLSFITSHPKDIRKELFELMADRPVIKKYLHLPIQSGSDRILKLMNRGYTAKKYLEIIDLYRSLVYNGQLSTDIIVGFPTEREEDFRDTFDLVKKIRFDSAYIFKYSPRPHTKAAEMEDDVAIDVKKKRHVVLLKVQKEISEEKKMEGRS